ncbi:hypothetical protein [Paenibacillus koleovorans]|uniref:hypothetical protein n=1 Tax=Paenibacillus koleovorans TaxID=121608 RepID=UPI000FDC6560|nr:hypothetical protein [Paenibacillus koleovorans]
METISKLVQCDRKLQALQLRKQTMIEINGDYKNYSRGVRSVLKAQRKQLAGIRGAVADLLLVPNPYEVALEVILGDKLECIITETEEDALLAINYLRQHRQGRVAFIPLNRVQGKRMSEQGERQLSQVKGFRGVALDLVAFDPVYRDVFTYLLGQTIIVDSLEVAIRCLPLIGKGEKIVTLHGEVIHNNGTIVGGTRTAARGHMPLMRNRAMAEIDLEIQTIEKERAALQKSKSNLNKR